MILNKLVLTSVALSGIAFAQGDGSFQVRYASNLDYHIYYDDEAAQRAPLGGLRQAPALGGGPDSIVNFTNTGANNARDICVNTYTFAPDEQLVSCCSCRVTRNALWSLGVGRDLTSNTLTPAVEDSVVIKLLATEAPAAGNCNPANPGLPVQGMAAWGTTLHFSNLTNGIGYGTETPFHNATLSSAERSVMTSFCGFIQANGSGFGICRACQTGDFGLGPNDPAYRRGLGTEKP